MQQYQDKANGFPQDLCYCLNAFHRYNGKVILLLQKGTQSKAGKEHAQKKLPSQQTESEQYQKMNLIARHYRFPYPSKIV